MWKPRVVFKVKHSNVAFVLHWTIWFNEKLFNILRQDIFRHEKFPFKLHQFVSRNNGTSLSQENIMISPLTSRITLHTWSNQVHTRGNKINKHISLRQGLSSHPHPAHDSRSPFNDKKNTLLNFNISLKTFSASSWSSSFFSHPNRHHFSSAFRAQRNKEN